MVKVYKDIEIDVSRIKDKTVAILGYGIQGKAWALNLRDSGLKVVVGLRPGKSYELAKRDGLVVTSIKEAVEKADIIVVLLPDMVQPKIWKEEVEPYLKPGVSVGFAHGFNIRYGLINPPSFVDVFLIAPKAPGRSVREEYKKGWGVPALVAVHQDPSGYAMDTALAVAKANGFSRVGLIETSFAEETETDLIGEQSVLVGGLMELIKNGFETLVELGYQPEVAYFEVLNEAKLIMDLVWEKGISGMLEGVSETARYGGLTVGSQIVDSKVKTNMKKFAERVRNGDFAKEWVKEYEEGAPRLKELMEKIRNHPIESTGEQLRKIANAK
jgi:ketol-acid reductoisomerase